VNYIILQIKWLLWKSMATTHHWGYSPKWWELCYNDSWLPAGWYNWNPVFETHSDFTFTAAI